MEPFKIFTDSCCDLPAKLAQDLKIEVLPLSVNFKGGSYPNYLDGSIRDFYDGLRDGEMPTTSAVNPEAWSQAMRATLTAGQDVLVLAFSSGLSTTYNSAVIAANELAEEFPERKILVVDTLCASVGQGLIVYLACQKRDTGASIEEVRQFVEDNKLQVAHWVAVDDLMHLKRGGRLNAATAVVGSMLKIKPIIHVDNEGKLINVAKARGRKASLDYLVEKVGSSGINVKEQTIFLSHSDCLADAEYIKKSVMERFQPKDFIISDIGPVIGSHTGIGTLALCFLASER